MRHLETYTQLLEKKTKIVPFIHIFNTLPKTVDYRIVEWMIENWGDIVKKSPYGFSYYNAEKGWDFTIDKSLRLSDHWNFYSRATMDQIHCKINISFKNNEYWTLARYNEKEDIYDEIMSYPYNYSKENEKKVADIKHKYKQDNFDYSELNKNLNMLKTYLNDNDLYVKVLYYNYGKFIEELYGKVDRLKGVKLSFHDEYNEKHTFNHTKFTKSEMFFYDSSNNLLYHKKRNQKIDN